LITAFAFRCLMLSAVARAADKPRLDLATADWSVNAPRSLVDDPPSDNEIKDFAAKINDGVAPEGVCSAVFADLRALGHAFIGNGFRYWPFLRS